MNRSIDNNDRNTYKSLAQMQIRLWSEVLAPSAMIFPQDNLYSQFILLKYLYDNSEFILNFNFEEQPTQELLNEIFLSIELAHKIFNIPVYMQTDEKIQTLISRGYRCISNLSGLNYYFSNSQNIKRVLLLQSEPLVVFWNNHVLGSIIKYRRLMNKAGLSTIVLNLLFTYTNEYLSSSSFIELAKRHRESLRNKPPQIPTVYLETSDELSDNLENFLNVKFQKELVDWWLDLLTTHELSPE